MLLVLLTLATTATAEPWNPTRAKFLQKSIVQNQPERTETIMQLTGNFPSWLSGSYFRNGPGSFDTMDGAQHVNSVFDGYSQIQKFTINGSTQTVTHTSKFVETARRQTLDQRGDMSYQGKIMFGTTPKRKENMLNVFNLGGEVSVNLFNVGGDHLLAVGELPYGQEINPDTLETIHGSDKKGGIHGDFFHYNDSISEMGVGCAHALTLPDTGDSYTRLAIIDMKSMATHTDYQIARIKKGTTTREVVATVKKLDAQITYAHSFAMANASLAVLPFWALGMTKIGAMTSDNLHPSMRWMPQHGTNLTVLNLETGESIQFICNETFFAFHITNSFVDSVNGDIVLDVVTYADDSLFLQMFLNSWRNGSAIDDTSLVGTLKRVVIPYQTAFERKKQLKEVWYSKSFLGASPPSSESDGEKGGQPTLLSSFQANISLLSEILIEGPRINDDYLTKPDLKSIYAWTSTRPKNIPNALVKINLPKPTTTSIISSFEEDVHKKEKPLMWKNAGDEFAVYIGEPVFISAPHATAEDDGIVIAAGVMVNTAERTNISDVDSDMELSSFLLFLNGSTMVEIGRAVLKNVTLPFAFHTQFYSSD